MNQQLVMVDCPICKKDAGLKPVGGSRTDHYTDRFGYPIAQSSWTFCRGCALLFQNPRPSSEAIRAFYAGNQYFGSLETDMARLLRMAVWKHREKLAYALGGQTLPEKDTLAAVDIGCGIGGCLTLMKESGLRPLGIEPDPKIGSLGRDQLGNNIRTGFFGEGLLEAKSACFFYSNHVFEHLENPASVVQAMRAALVTGGSVFTCVPTYGRNSSWEAYAWQNLSHNFIFTHKTLAALFETNGFRVDRWKYKSGANELWMVATKLPEGTVSTVALPRLSTADTADYYVGVPLRAVFFLPVRITYLMGELWNSVKSNGWVAAMKQMGVLFRAPVGYLYRSLRSLRRQNAVTSP